MTEFLDKELINKYYEIINSTNIFYESEKYKEKWNLICAVIDRLRTIVHWLNAHSQKLESEEEFVLFMVYGTILKDGVYKLYEGVYNEKPVCSASTKWFANAFTYSQYIFNDETRPTDDSFFEYLRSVVFAHPFETTKRKRTFMQAKEAHYSPWVFSSYADPKKGYSVGVRIYTNSCDDIKDIFVRFEDLKAYLNERYQTIKLFIEWMQKEIQKQNDDWEKRKIIREGNNEDILKDAINILNNRYQDSSELQFALDFLLYKTEINKNLLAMKKIKKMIKKILPLICDDIDNLKTDEISDSLSFLFKRPHNIHSNGWYQLEKTFDYLDDECNYDDATPGSNLEWGLLQARNFYDMYANKYVQIEFGIMSFKEIKLLIQASCILGFLDETKEII